ncbi:unnamed protein product [Peniophora sp. CBMAI 1063]|nr:unnamed protein product [Peniophora sp. CBMAI 1063]
MRSFGRQIRIVARRSYAALRPHWQGDVYATKAGSVSEYTFVDESSQLVKVDLDSNHTSKSSSESSSASSSSSSLTVNPEPTVKFAHIHAEDTAITATVPVCRRIMDPPPILDDSSDGPHAGPALDPLTGLHSLSPPPFHSRARKHAAESGDPEDASWNEDASNDYHHCTDELLRFPF